MPKVKLLETPFMRGLIEELEELEAAIKIHQLGFVIVPKGKDKPCTTEDLIRARIQLRERIQQEIDDATNQ